MRAICFSCPYIPAAGAPACLSSPPRENRSILSLLLLYVWHCCCARGFGKSHNFSLYVLRLVPEYIPRPAFLERAIRPLGVGDCLENPVSGGFHRPATIRRFRIPLPNYSHSFFFFFWSWCSLHTFEPSTLYCSCCSTVFSLPGIWRVGSSPGLRGMI
jgi:hypothetical protein